MSTPKKAKASKKQAPSHNIIWFEVPTDDLGRAKKFYGKLFGWKIKKFPGPMEYLHIDTGGGDDTPDGGMMKRMQPGQGITNYIRVPSVDKWVVKVQKLGGKVCMPKTAVPQMGYFAVCLDTENNSFAVWEPNPDAK